MFPLKKEGVPIANGKFSNSRQSDGGQAYRRTDVQEDAFLDSSELNEDWEHFLETVGSRYGAQDTPQQPPKAKQPEKPQDKPVPPAPAPVKPQKTRKDSSGVALRIIAILAVLVVLAMAAVIVVPKLLQPGASGGSVQEGVSVAGVEVGGMSQRQAEKALKASLSDVLAKNDMEITLPDVVLKLAAKDVGASLDTKRLAANACEVHAGDQIPDLRPYLNLNETFIRGVLEDYAARYSEIYAPSTFTAEGAVPALDEEHFDENAPCPKLVLTKGTSGFGLNMDDLYEMILDTYCSGSFKVEAGDVLAEVAPEALDLDAIAEQLCAAPVDAKMDPATHKAIPGSYGYGFDRDKVQAQLDQIAPGETLEVQLEYIAPEIIGQEVYFQDVLGFCQTPHGNNKNRNNNLRLACSVLNGIVIQPGETLSYNFTLGQRTEANGYQPAPAYSGTKLIDSIGGGICQVSSTLYLCSLYAELETVERVNHGFPVNYIPYGLDATVSWGSPDLKIKNASPYPVKIVAEAPEDCDFVRIWIMGTETRDYYIRMGFGSSGSYARNYICKYSRATDEQISREANALSGYLDEVTSLKGEIGMNEAYVTGNVREQPPCEPTPETLEASRNYKSPNQHAE